MTTAQKIAAQFDNNGQRWETDGGEDWADVVGAEDPTEDWRDGEGMGSAIRFTFADGSVLMSAGDGWDFGYPDCYCWRGEGHQGTACPLSPDHEED